MTEPIGRKSIKSTIQRLKAHLDYKRNQFTDYKDEILIRRTKIVEKDESVEKTRTLRELIRSVHAFRGDTFDLLVVYNIYVGVLESYLSELDETFDKILEEARKMAEQQIKEMPKERPEFYG